MKSLPDHLEDILGYPGKLISGSKGRYGDSHPNNIAIFNANLVLKTCGKVWYGDIDITIEFSKLLEVRSKINEDIYVLRESDARFENEKDPKFDNFLAIIKADGIICKRWNGDHFLFPVDLAPSYKHLNPNRVEKRILNKERDKRIAEAKAEYDLKNQEDGFKPFDFPEIPAGSKKIDPVSALQEKLIKLHGKDQAQTLWSDGYISKSDKDKIMEAVKLWLNKFKRIPKNSYEMKKNLAWIPMELPREFLHEPSWTVSGQIYVRKA